MARGDIYIVGLPESDGREEKGNRPSVAVQTDTETSPMLMIVPLTSSLAATKYHVSFDKSVSP